MTPTLRQQIDSAIESAEQQLESSKHQPQPDPRVIEGNEKELRVLKNKQSLMVK